MLKHQFNGAPSGFSRVNLTTIYKDKHKDWSFQPQRGKRAELISVRNAKGQFQKIESVNSKG